MASDAQQQQTQHPASLVLPPKMVVVPTYAQNAPLLQGATRSKHWTGNMTRTIAHYQRMEQIGEGAYGQVYKARCVESGRSVALKKLIIQHGGYNGMTPSVIREIKILQRLRHPRLVEMIEVVSSKGVEHLDEHDEHRGDQRKRQELSQDNSSRSESRIIDAREGYKGNLFLVLEYVSHDLMALLDVRYQFSEQQVKCIFKQLLEALEYMHDQKYVHRDLKPANILIDSQHRVKLADFGLARCIEPPILDKLHDRRSSLELTNKVVTVMYRPIEILLGATRYGYSIDMWSAGCILAELVLGKTLMAGKLELEQINLIFDLLGTPTQNDSLQDLPLLKTGKIKIDKPRPSRLREKYVKKISLPCLNLLEKLLELDPAKRLAASRALESRYFKAEPRAPDFPEQLGPLQLGNGDCDVHEFQTKKKRKEVKSIAAAAREEARDSGMTDEAAEAVFREVYDEQMLRVQEEGSSALKTREEREKEEEKKLREEEKKREEADKQREDERSKSRRHRSVEDDRRHHRDKKRHVENDDQLVETWENVERKRRKREDDDSRKSDRRSDQDNKKRDEDISKGDRRREDDDKRDVRRSIDKGRDRKRSSDSRDKDRRRSSHDNDREERRREKDRHRLAIETSRLDESSAVVDDILDPNMLTPNELDLKETKGRDSDNRSRESKRHREHKKSSRRDRDRERHPKTDSDRRERDRVYDYERRRRRDDSDREGDRGAPPDSFHGSKPVHDSHDRRLDNHGHGNSFGPPLSEQRGVRGSSDLPRFHDTMPIAGGNRDDRGSAPSDRENRAQQEYRTDSILPSEMISRGPDRRIDRPILPSDRDTRGAPDRRNDIIRHGRDSRGARDHPNDRRPPTHEWDDRNQVDRRIGRGPIEPWSDNGPPPRDRGSRGPPDRRGDRGPPLGDRDSRGPSRNDRGPTTLDRDNRVFDHPNDRGSVPGDRRGHPEIPRDRNPPPDNLYGPGARESYSGPAAGFPLHRDDRPPRINRRVSPPRNRRH